MATSEWLHFHQTNTSAPPPHTATNSPTDLFWSGQLSEATVVSTTMNSGTTNPSPSPGPTQQLAPEGGRVSKPARRRTRASRRTPTTLLNTDTTNFRAMVQQFTGGSSTAFGFRPGPGPTVDQGRWDPMIGGQGSGTSFGLQFPYGDDHGIGRRNDLVQPGAGAGGDVFGNLNVGIFPGTGGGSSSSENRSSSNIGSGGGGYNHF